MTDILQSLRERGLLSFTDDEQFLSELSKRSVTVYNGFDPTANSLHVGHLLPLMGLRRFQDAGHRPIALIGGGTGLIGDPSGKSEERVLLTPEVIEENVQGIRKQMERLLDFDQTSENGALLLNNIEWIGKLSFVDFLRKVGKHFRVNEMIQKESVKKRMEGDVGISLTEFCYQTLQAYDFVELNKRYDCQMQAGGQDQWGNIAAGIDLVRRMGGPRVHGVCYPLLTKADGTKYGKTEGGAVWLDPELTSPFDFYQFWVRSDDRDVVKLLKFFTLLDMEQIAELESQLNAHPEKREAQKRLAYEMTSLVHGTEEADKALAATTQLYTKNIAGADDEQIRTIFKDAPSTQMTKARLTEGLMLVDALAETGLCKSKGEARRQIKQGGVYVNDERCNDVEKKLGTNDLASDNFLILRRGKKNYHLIQFD